MNQTLSLTERIQGTECREPHQFYKEGEERSYRSEALELPGKTQATRQEPIRFPAAAYVYRAEYSLRNVLYVLSQTFF